MTHLDLRRRVLRSPRPRGTGTVVLPADSPRAAPGPRLGGAVDIARRTLSAGGAGGGDFTVVVPLPGGSVGIGIGDVAGHGEAVTGTMRHLRRAMLGTGATGAPPGEVLSRLNRLVLALDDDLVVTATYAVVHPGPRTVVHASAGHLPLLCAVPDDVWPVRADVGVPLGVDRTAGYAERIAALPAAATLLAYTDGLVERRGEDIDAGLLRLRTAARAGGDLPLSLQVGRIFLALAAGATDDVTLVGVRLPAAP